MLSDCWHFITFPYYCYLRTRCFNDGSFEELQADVYSVSLWLFGHQTRNNLSCNSMHVQFFGQYVMTIISASSIKVMRWFKPTRSLNFSTWMSSVDMVGFADGWSSLIDGRPLLNRVNHFSQDGVQLSLLIFDSTHTSEVALTALKRNHWNLRVSFYFKIS